MRNTKKKLTINDLGLFYYRAGVLLFLASVLTISKNNVGLMGAKGPFICQVDLKSLMSQFSSTLHFSAQHTPKQSNPET